MTVTLMVEVYIEVEAWGLVGCLLGLGLAV